ncbi:hypothetical protein LIER_37906 [Lithospermum erythrorhizon]|uniref:Uncharacterized protein n=1 Tax=Lithospermum erythrorhizon TaxID=34254 RepID=A0AAV3PTR3_LITER
MQKRKTSTRPHGTNCEKLKVKVDLASVIFELYFNLALLSKQAWRIIYEPDSLLSRVFKARYFPNDSFRTAQLGVSPNYTWRSLIAVRDLIYQGIH